MDDNLKNIVENILSLKVQLIKKLINREIISSIIPRDGQFVLAILEKKGSATMSEISKELYIPKPNVTPLVDKLVENNFIERTTDPNDRRIVRIKITEKGSEALTHARELLKPYISQKLSVLSEDDLNKLADSLTVVKEIIQKIQ